MKKTVLITGSSTGIGKDTALFFHQKGWNVAGTMRNPEKRETELHKFDDILKLHLDVLDTASIQAAIKTTQEKFGKIDAIVNNAGYGLVGPFEASTNAQIKRQFDTNVFGLMEVIREILPVFRAQNSGTIINVASVGGRITFPLFSLYHGTKWAVEGFSESLQHELKPHNIRVKIVEPGAIKTDFYDRSMDIMKKDDLTVYDDYVNNAMKNMNEAGKNAPPGTVVAKVIFKAATDNSKKLRYAVNTNGLLMMRRFLPDRIFNGMMGAIVTR